MPIVADAAVAVRGDLSKFNQDLAQGGEKGARTFGERFKSALNPKNLIGPGVAAVGAMVVAGLADAAKSLIEIERLNAQTDSVIRSTGGVANVTRAGVEELAEGIESLTTVERESVQEGANLLLTFKNIRNEAGEGNDIFDQATTSLVDMSVAMGTDVKSGAIQLGKALNDPIAGIAALSRVGITFTETQKDMITSMVEAGDVLGAQKIILAELESQFGGSAEAFANTTAGRIQRFQNDVGNMFESIIVGATKVADAMGGATEDVGTSVDVLALHFGEMGDRGNTLADRLGISFDELKGRVRTSMEETGLSLEETLRGMETDAATSAHGITASMAEGMRGTHQIVVDKGAEIRANWQATADFIPQAVRDRWDDMRIAGFQQQVEYAKGILDGQNDVKVAIEAALQIAEDEMTRTEEIAYLSGRTTVLNEARGIASAEGRHATVIAIDGALGIIHQRMQELGVYAQTYGYNAGASFAAGLANSVGVVRDAAGQVAWAAEGQIGIRSEPRDPTSPLRGITQWGGNVAETYAEGILSRLDMVSSAASQLAKSLVPDVVRWGDVTPEAWEQLQAQGWKGRAGDRMEAIYAPTGAGATYVINVNGVQRTVSTAEEAMRVLDELGAFGDGRLN